MTDQHTNEFPAEGRHPYAGHPYPAAPPPPPKKRHPVLKALAVVGTVALVITLWSAITKPGVEPETVTAAPTEASKAPAKPKAKPYTLDVTGCERDDNEYLEQVEVKVKITNNSDTKTDYFFDVSVESPDGDVVGTGFGSITDVRGGKSGKTDVFTMITDEDYDGDVVCLVEVTKW